MKFLIFTTILFLTNISKPKALNRNIPIVLWSGLGDNFENVNYVVNQLEMLTLRKIYVIQFTKFPSLDTIISYFFPLFQVTYACNWLHYNKKHFLNGFDGIGISQGGVFLRILSQTCTNGPKMVNLLTLASPHRGISHVPMCSICDAIITAYNISEIVYNHSYKSSSITFLSYWHDVYQEKLYREKSLIGYMNYHGKKINFERLIMIQQLDDDLVLPHQSACFEYYNPKLGQNHIQSFNESEIYWFDTIGLKKLYDSNNMVCISNKGRHNDIKITFIAETVMKYFID
ncbi:hypothetical protein A3Q56_08008 [Intoshia linei]|uniref:palmitoyl-CoA hydrolase n=1 Tax=Intoshia linei TaxID=1819745 RepID=A0A177AR47_9BILA|nr:hypothetical protein A3Q56_08008 [Intoshia linei]